MAGNNSLCLFSNSASDNSINSQSLEIQNKESSKLSLSKLVTSYKLNKNNCVKKLLDASFRDKLAVEETRGGYVLSWSAGHYNEFREMCEKYFFNSCHGQDLSITKKVDSEENSESVTIRVFSTKIKYTLNLYHTTSKVLLNGKNSDKFFQVHLPHIMEMINENKAQQINKLLQNSNVGAQVKKQKVVCDSISRISTPKVNSLEENDDSFKLRMEITDEEEPSSIERHNSFSTVNTDLSSISGENDETPKTSKKRTIPKIVNRLSRKLGKKRTNTENNLETTKLKLTISTLETEVQRQRELVRSKEACIDDLTLINENLTSKNRHLKLENQDLMQKIEELTKTQKSHESELLLELQQFKKDLNSEKQHANSLKKDKEEFFNKTEAQRREIENLTKTIKTLEYLRSEVATSSAIKDQIPVANQERRAHNRAITAKILSDLPNAIIGSSILKEILPNRMDYTRSTEIRSLRGGKVCDVKTFISRCAPSTKNKTFIFLIGSNDGSEENFDLETCVEEYKSLISSTRSKFPNSNIKFMEVLPRTKNRTNLEKLNVKLNELCVSLDCDFISTRQFFCHDSGEMKNYLFSDGVHLNMKGTAQLVKIIKKTLKMPVRQKGSIKPPYGNVYTRQVRTMNMMRLPDTRFPPPCYYRPLTYTTKPSDRKVQYQLPFYYPWYSKNN